MVILVLDNADAEVEWKLLSDCPTDEAVGLVEAWLETLEEGLKR